MSDADQVLCGERAAAPEVRGDRVDARVIDLSADEHDRQAQLGKAEEEAIRLRRLKRRHDDAAKALSVERLERLNLGAGEIAGGGDEGRVPASLGVGLDGPGEHDGVGVEQIAGQDADDARAFGLEHPGVGVRDVLQSIDGVENGGAGRGADVAGVVQDSRDGGGGGAGESGDVEDGGVGHGCGNDCISMGGCQRIGPSDRLE